MEDTLATLIADGSAGERGDASTTAITPTSSSVVLCDADFTTQLESLARDIEHLERTAIFRIAKCLAKAHELFLYRRDEGGFQGWAKNRLGYSRSKAYRLLAVDRWVECFPSWNTFGTLPASAIYQLAASSTPPEVSAGIVERLNAGERLSLAAVNEAIASAKQNDADSTDVTESANGKNVVRLPDWKTGKETVEPAGTDHTVAEERDHGDPENHDDGDEHNGGDHDQCEGDDRDQHDSDRERNIDHITVDPATPPAPPSSSGSRRSKHDSSKPETETLIAHYRRENKEVRAGFFDDLTVDGMLADMSDEFGQQLRAKMPTPKLYETDADTIASTIFETLGAAKSDAISKKLQGLAAVS